MLLPKYHALLVICFLCIASAMTGCGPGNPGIVKNKDIASGKRDDFHALNKQLFDACKAKKVYDVEVILSKEMLQDNQYRRTAEIIGNRAADGYDLLDEYYIVNYKPTDVRDTLTTAMDGTRYKMRFHAETQEMYIAFLATKSATDKWMISATYCKFDYGWKLSMLDIQKYTIEGKSAPQIFQLSKEQYLKGYLIDAYDNIEIAAKCMQPSQLWIYPELNEIGLFNGKVAMEAASRFKFPIVVDAVAGKPSIFNISDENRDQGTYPAIYYISKINVNDTTAVKKENADLRNVIGKVFPGIDKDNKYLYFSIYNKKPSGKQSTPSFEIVRKVL